MTNLANPIKKDNNKKIKKKNVQTIVNPSKMENERKQSGQFNNIERYHQHKIHKMMEYGLYLLRAISNAHKLIIHRWCFIT